MSREPHVITIVLGSEFEVLDRLPRGATVIITTVWDGERYRATNLEIEYSPTMTVRDYFGSGEVAR